MRSPFTGTYRALKRTEGGDNACCAHGSAAEKKLVGCILGSSNPAREFPRLVSLWRAGRLDLDGMVTARRPLEHINEAFVDMRAGMGLRTVITL